MAHSPKQKQSDSQPEENGSVLQIRGKASLAGEVPISGAKNAALVIMAGALLCPDDCRIRNVPDLVDVSRMRDILSSLGMKVTQYSGLLDMDARDVRQSKPLVNW